MAECIIGRFVMREKYYLLVEKSTVYKSSERGGGQGIRQCQRLVDRGDELSVSFCQNFLLFNLYVNKASQQELIGCLSSLNRDRSSLSSSFVQSSSWPKAKTVVKKWLNLKDSEFHSDCIGKLAKSTTSSHSFSARIDFVSVFLFPSKL